MTKVIIRKNWNDTEKISLAPGVRMTRINREVYRNFFTGCHLYNCRITANDLYFRTLFIVARVVQWAADMTHCDE